MNKKSPNEEQIRAIRHEGGVVLSAGAGSGKTFVIIEHVIYLLEQFKKDRKHLNLEEFENELRNYLPSLVLMTFTKKAAGELGLRLKKRMDFYHQKGDCKGKWNEIKNNISLINVTTIHGLCYKLLVAGYFKQFSSNLQIVSDIEIHSKIKDLFQKWYLKNEKNCRYKRKSFQSLLVNADSIILSFCSIFSSPELRIAWGCSDYVNDTNLDSFFNDYFKFTGLKKFFGHNFNLNEYLEFKDKAWFNFLNGFINLLSNIQSFDKISYQKFLDFFGGYKVIRGPSKKLELDKVDDAIERAKVFKKFLVDNHEDFFAYFEHGDSEFRQWALMLKDAFDFIERHYMDNPGVSFSDLEYYVLKGLECSETVDKISRDFSYLIVDEFQDTSEIQSSIIKKLVKYDYGKLFCVGDMKQAIYGFRGGELAVFKEYMKIMPKTLSMKNNYRSCQNVISFNNRFFGKIFTKGPGYQGEDEHSVPCEPQNIPQIADGDEKGRLVKVDIKIYTDEKMKKNSISSKSMEEIEAHMIYCRIEDIQKAHPADDICILYKKLGPSRFLISRLIDNNLSFLAQIKVPLNEDPILEMFYLLIGEYLKYSPNDNSSNSTLSYDFGYINFILKNYLKILEIRHHDKLEEDIKQFFDDVLLYGLIESFNKFVFSVGISNSNYYNNIDLIESVCSANDDDPEKIWKMLGQNNKQKYSMDFHFGEEEKRIYIMSAHASKGLEFNHIIIGGVHTNGKSVQDHSYIGKLPGSYKWKKSLGQKTPYKSPYYLFEKLVEKRKDFSESKRLFYVVCTRAINSVTWIDLSFGDKRLGFFKDSWINAIRKWEDESGDDLTSQVQINKIKNEYKFDNVFFKKESSISPPLFHLDKMGISNLRSFEIQSSEPQSFYKFNIGCVPELSVTRLALLADCPRKFYLRNICQLTDDDLTLMNLNKLWINQNSLKEEESYFHDETVDIRSTKKRGSLIHNYISDAINNNFIFPADGPKTKDLDSINWILDEIRPFRDGNHLISEKAYKFSFYNMMITGIPDLLIRPFDDTGNIIIWDFKTGARDKDNENIYWFQLMAYGKMCFNLQMIKEASAIDLYLAYLDEKLLIKKNITLKEIDHFLFYYFSQLSSLKEIRKDSCAKCQFERLCYFKN